MTPHEIAEAEFVNDGRVPHGLRPWVTEMMRRAIEADRAGRVPFAATAQDCEVTRFTDDAGRWVSIEIGNPDAREHSVPDTVVCSVLLSDVEAADHADQLLAAAGYQRVSTEDLEVLLSAATKWASEVTHFLLPGSPNDETPMFEAGRAELLAVIDRYRSDSEKGI